MRCWLIRSVKVVKGSSLSGSDWEVTSLLKPAVTKLEVLDVCQMLLIAMTAEQGIEQSLLGWVT